MGISCSPFDRWAVDRGGWPPRQILGPHPSPRGDILMWQHVFNSSITTSEGTTQFSGKDTVESLRQLIHHTPSDSLKRKGHAVFTWFFGLRVDKESEVKCVYWFFVGKPYHKVDLAFCSGRPFWTSDGWAFVCSSWPTPGRPGTRTLLVQDQWARGRMCSYGRHLTSSCSWNSYQPSSPLVHPWSGHPLFAQCP